MPRTRARSVAKGRARPRLPVPVPPPPSLSDGKPASAGAASSPPVNGPRSAIGAPRSGQTSFSGRVAASPRTPQLSLNTGQQPRLLRQLPANSPLPHQTQNAFPYLSCEYILHKTKHAVNPSLQLRHSTLNATKLTPCSRQAVRLQHRRAPSRVSEAPSQQLYPEVPVCHHVCCL